MTYLPRQGTLYIKQHLDALSTFLWACNRSSLRLDFSSFTHISVVIRQHNIVLLYIACILLVSLIINRRNFCLQGIKQENFCKKIKWLLYKLPRHYKLTFYYEIYSTRNLLKILKYKFIILCGDFSCVYFMTCSNILCWLLITNLISRIHPDDNKWFKAWSVSLYRRSFDSLLNDL